MSVQVMFFIADVWFVRTDYFLFVLNECLLRAFFIHVICRCTFGTFSAGSVPFGAL